MAICISILFYAPLIVLWFDISRIYSNPFFRCLEFIIGIILASIKDEVNGPKLLYTKTAFLIEFIVLIVGVTMAVKRNIKIGDYMLYSWIGLPIYILMLFTLSKAENAKGYGRIITYLSSISYCYYLVQSFVWKSSDFILRIIGKDNNTLRIIVTFHLVIIYAIMAHELIEKPASKLLVKRMLKS